MCLLVQGFRLAGRGLATCLIFGALAQGQEIPKVLSRGEAIDLAIARNPSIKADRNEVEMLEGDRITASQRLNPAATVETENYPYFSSNVGPFFSNQEIIARVDYEIETRGRRRLRTLAADRAVEARQSVHADRVRQLRLEVQRAFCAVVLAQGNLEVARSVLDQTDEVISLNRVRFEQGDISQLELRRVEVERLRFIDDVFQSELALRNAKSTLLSLLNADDLGRELEVIGNLPVEDPASEPWLPPPASLVELQRIAIEKRPDLHAATLEELRMDAETRLQRAIRSANVTVGGGYKRNGPDNSLVFGITVPLKIFKRNEGGILRADAERERKRNLAEAVRNRIELDIHKAYNAVEINRRRVEYLETQHLDKAREANTVTLAAYRLGGATLIDYLDAARQYSDAVRGYNQALYDRRISLYELGNAMGLEGGNN